MATQKRKTGRAEIVQPAPSTPVRNTPIPNAGRLIPAPVTRGPIGEPQLIVIAKVSVPLSPGMSRPFAALPVPGGTAPSAVDQVLKQHGATVRPLFGVSEERVERHLK